MKPCLILLMALASVSALAADLQQYGRAYLAEGNSAAAVQSYGELVRQNPFDPVALNNMAIAKAAAGDYQSALELLTRAARLAPQRSDIRENLTQLQSWQQQTHSITLNPVGQAGSTRPRNHALLPEPPPLWPQPTNAASAARAEPAARR
ncbi:MAG: Tetratricopeptide repeat [Pseudomonadota bacterium]|jgi:Flp pilus assembly protein TadD